MMKITIEGPQGCGKTKIAYACIAALAADYPNGPFHKKTVLWFTGNERPIFKDRSGGWGSSLRKTADIVIHEIQGT